MLEFNATFIVAMFSFIVFIFIMNAIFYKPVLKIIDEREKYINDLYDDAKISNNKAQELLDDKKRKLNEAAKDAKNIVLQKIQDTNKSAKISTNFAKKDADLKIQSAKDKLKVEELETSKSLSKNVKELADMMSDKILGNRE